MTWEPDDVEFVPMMNPLNRLTYRYKYSVTEVPGGFMRLRVLRTDL
jgi:hypothetical protein